MPRIGFLPRALQKRQSLLGRVAPVNCLRDSAFELVLSRRSQRGRFVLESLGLSGRGLQSGVRIGTAGLERRAGLSEGSDFDAG